jgi:hypothetical protein
LEPIEVLSWAALLVGVGLSTAATLWWIKEELLRKFRDKSETGSAMPWDTSKQLSDFSAQYGGITLSQYAQDKVKRSEIEDRLVGMLHRPPVSQDPPQTSR